MKQLFSHIRQESWKGWRGLIPLLFALFVYKAVSTIVLTWFFMSRALSTNSLGMGGWDYFYCSGPETSAQQTLMTLSIFSAVLTRCGFFMRWRGAGISAILGWLGIVFLATCFLRGAGLVAYMQILFNSKYVSGSDVLPPWVLTLFTVAICSAIVFIDIRARLKRSDSKAS